MQADYNAGRFWVRQIPITRRLKPVNIRPVNTRKAASPIAKSVLGLGLAVFASLASAEAVTYNVDPSHTYPAFEADHMGGLSIWRGKFKKTNGTVVVDTAKKTGTVDITVDMNSVDFGHDLMNEHAKGKEIFDVATYPTAVFKGALSDFNNDKPTKVVGTLTLHGVTKPLTLSINQFLCKVNPMSKKEVCGADALATFNRDDFGVDIGKNFGFKMEVTLRISIEATRV